MILPGNVGYVKNFNAYPANTRDRQPGRLQGAAEEGGVPERRLHQAPLLHERSRAPRIAQVDPVAASTKGGFKVTIVPVTTAPTSTASTCTRPSHREARGLGCRRRPAGFPTGSATTAARSLQPLFTDPGVGTVDYGGYVSPVTEKLIADALTAESQAEAAKLWTKANIQTMRDAPAVSLNASKSAIFVSSRVQGCNFFFWSLSCDITNIWLQ